MKKNGLTLEQEKAANLIALGKSITDKQVAREVGCSVNTLRGWKKDYKFKVRVLQLFEGNIDLERAYRTKRLAKYLKPVYSEINARLKEDDSLENVPLRELLRMMTVLHAELRMDGKFNKSFIKPEEEVGMVPDSGDELGKARSKYIDDRKEGKVIPMIR